MGGGRRLKTYAEELQVVLEMERTNGAAIPDIARRYGYAYLTSVYSVYRKVRGKTFSAAGYGTSHRWKELKPRSDKEEDPMASRNQKSRAGAMRSCGELNQNDLYREDGRQIAGCGILIPPDAPRALCEDCLEKLAGKYRLIQVEPEVFRTYLVREHHLDKEDSCIND